MDLQDRMDPFPSPPVVGGSGKEGLADPPALSPTQSLPKSENGPARHPLAARPRIPCKCATMYVVATGIGSVVEGRVGCKKCGEVLSLPSSACLPLDLLGPEEDTALSAPPETVPCVVCGKLHEGRRTPLFPVVLSDLAGIAQAREPNKILYGPGPWSPYIRLVICKHCQAGYCLDCAHKTVRSHWWSPEFGKCIRCGQTLALQPAGFLSLPDSHASHLAIAGRGVICEKCSRIVSPVAAHCECGAKMFARMPLAERLGHFVLSACLAAAGAILGLIVYTVARSLAAESFNGDAAQQLPVLLGGAVALPLLGWSLWHFVAVWAPLPASGLFLRRAAAKASRRPSEAADDVIRALLAADKESFMKGWFSSDPSGPRPLAEGPDPLARAVREAERQVDAIERLAPHLPALASAKALLSFHRE